MTGFPIVLPAVTGLAGRAAVSRDRAEPRAVAGGFAAASAAAALLMSNDPMDYPAWLGPFQQFFGVLPAAPAAVGAAFLIGWSFAGHDPAWLRILSALLAAATLLPLIAIVFFMLTYSE
jgi:hypothetical protein